MKTILKKKTAFCQQTSQQTLTLPDLAAFH